MTQYDICLGSSLSYSKKIFTLKKEIITNMISALLQIQVEVSLKATFVKHDSQTGLMMVNEDRNT